MPLLPVSGTVPVTIRVTDADPAVDVSEIARQEGGGGHKAAAGFSSRRDPAELLAWVGRELAARLDRDGARG